MKNKVFIFLIASFNIIFLVGEFILYKRLSGLYVGSILSVILIIFYNNFKFIDYIFKIILISNLLILIINLFFREYLLIPPFFSSGDNVFEQDIIRNISLGSYIISLRRTTGIIDNIHVSTLLLLYLIFIFFKKKKKILFTFTSVIFILTLNFQYILVYILFFLILKYNAFFKKNTKIIFLFTPLLFIIIDYIFLDQAYYYQISNSRIDLLVKEFIHYVNFFDVDTFLYGIKPNMIDDPYNALAGFYIPLTDIGLIGIPIQFGVFGVISILLNIFYGITFFPKEFKLLYKILLITIIHYFSLASFIGLLSTYWLSLYFFKIEKK